LNYKEQERPWKQMGSDNNSPIEWNKRALKHYFYNS